MLSVVSQSFLGQRSRRRGIALIYATAWIAAGAGFIALAVDFGRVQAAKIELNNAIEAAVRDGVVGLSSGTAVSRAIGTAALNKVDAQNFVLNARHSTWTI